jgi:hypothetical protein
VVRGRTKSTIFRSRTQFGDHPLIDVTPPETSKVGIAGPVEAFAGQFAIDLLMILG